MLIEFRQGIYRQQDTRPFLTLTDKGVNLNVDDNPTIVTLAHGRGNYLFTEDFPVVPAWRGPFPIDEVVWLYWDINLTTGVRTFDYTSTDPFIDGGYGNSLPISPIGGQHFFLIPENEMKYYNGYRWKTVIRVFAGTVNKDSVLTLFETGTQVGRHIQTNAGHILFNDDNVPIKRSGLFGSSEFATTETKKAWTI